MSSNTFRAKQLKNIGFWVTALSIYSILPFSNSFILDFIYNTTFWWLISTFILYQLWVWKKYFFKKTDAARGIITVNVFLWWMMFNIVRGLFIAHTYWDWKGLVSNAMALLLPLAVYSAVSLEYTQNIMKYYIKYALPLFILIFPLSIHADLGFYLVPITLILLFLSTLEFKWKVSIAAIAIITIIIGLAVRSNVIRFSVAILLSNIYYFRRFISLHFIKALMYVLFAAPIIFLFLGVFSNFNVFDFQNYISGDYSVKTDKNEKGGVSEQSLLSDSRTFIYRDALQTASYYNSWLIGRSPARGTISSAFAETDLNKRGERLANEVGISNIFTWTGIVGVILYFFVFFRASYTAIYKSGNNIFAKILGLYIAFHWVYSWVENFTNFTMNYFMIWVMIGLCFSTQFRQMTNQQVKVWVRGIFNVRYRRRRLPPYVIKNSQSEISSDLDYNG
ncbi:MAG: hypothetical protein PWP52_386 [Bacteroidales bacterium]|nr:hypothetical protein [Bacteroidales bacterium]